MRIRKSFNMRPLDNAHSLHVVYHQGSHFAVCDKLGCVEMRCGARSAYVIYLETNNLDMFLEDMRMVDRLERSARFDNIPLRPDAFALNVA